jgi:hypothetical protein
MMANKLRKGLPPRHRFAKPLTSDIDLKTKFIQEAVGNDTDAKPSSALAKSGSVGKLAPINHIITVPNAQLAKLPQTP